MKGVIRVGDKNTGGGRVLSSSSTTIFNGVRIARQGDPVYCPIVGHGETKIAEGRDNFIDDGRPVAFDGNCCGCGCALISSLPSAGVSL
ncbi:PAAR domain-containing protein [Pseudomonas putida]|uniref:PAAR domain-containing protein n=1 Tax=Pseudomonas putida TaxID=303 RepID=UPI0018D7F76D|nr:PAAR domain-containing protein [Pseudomonas putida]MBH3417232.1 PAAR domain-containing protein [Pseudomonas putida]MDG9813160.1 PAAR domain-containing protein [Pseudomonas putida]